MSVSRRVTVTSPQTRLAHSRRRYRGPWRPTTLDPAEAPRAVWLYERQRRGASVALTMLCVLVFGLPLMLATAPELDSVRILGVPVSWLAMVVVPFPSMVLLAFWHLWKAERVERPPSEGEPPGAGEDGG